MQRLEFPLLRDGFNRHEAHRRLGDRFSNRLRIPSSFLFNWTYALTKRE
jgi:hypothetical protein